MACQKYASKLYTTFPIHILSLLYGFTDSDIHLHVSCWNNAHEYQRVGSDVGMAQTCNICKKPNYNI